MFGLFHTEYVNASRVICLLMVELHVLRAPRSRTCSRPLYVHVTCLDAVFQTPPGGLAESTFTPVDGKASPTSILCTVEAGTSTPPVPATEDKVKVAQPAGAFCLSCVSVLVGPCVKQASCACVRHRSVFLNQFLPVHHAWSLGKFAFGDVPQLP